MSKKLSLVVIIIAACAFVLSVITMIVSLVKINSLENRNEDVQYVLYLGTNDKDSNEFVFASKEVAQEELKKILLNHFGGYTIQEAQGGWVDGEITYKEYTLVIYLSDTSLEEVHSACDDMINVFHQSSVLIQTNKTVTEFYGGK